MLGYQISYLGLIVSSLRKRECTYHREMAYNKTNSDQYCGPGCVCRGLGMGGGGVVVMVSNSRNGHVAYPCC